MALTESHIVGPRHPAVREMTLGDLLRSAVEAAPERIALIAGVADPALPSLRLTDGHSRLEGPGIAMSNAFAFGGNNLSLLIGALP